MDWKTWAIRVVVVGVAAGLYTLSELVLKGTGSQGPVAALAGLLVASLLPQLAAGKQT